MSTEKIKQIVVVCYSGMATSAMGASILSRLCKEAGVDLPVRYQSVWQVDDDEGLLVVTQPELMQLAHERLPKAQTYVVANGLDYAGYAALAAMLSCPQTES